jgi:hypothetical protein
MKFTASQKELIRQKVLELTNLEFKKTEDEIGIEIPQDFKELFSDKIVEMVPSNTSDLKKLKNKITIDSQTFLLWCNEEGGELDPGCKLFLESLIDILFSSTHNKGIGNNLWKYFSNLWYYGKTVEEISNLEDDQISTNTKIYQVLSFYQTFYEFTLHYLVEIAFVIADNETDTASQQFAKYYIRKSSQGQIPMKGKLLEYCRNKKIIKDGQCSFFRDSWIRNGIAHSNYRYDEETHLIIIGKKTLTFDELMKSFQTLYRFNVFLLSRYLQRSNTMEDLLKLISQYEMKSASRP